MQDAEVLINSLSKQLEECESERERMKCEIEENELEISDLNNFKESRLKELTCNCGFLAQSNHALSGHKKGCKGKERDVHLCIK
jgi:hypothetical protein